MKNIAFNILFLITVSSSATDKKTEFVKWKTFQSDYGYEFKYPDCWKVVIDSPDEKGEISQIKSILIKEDAECETVRLDKETPNGIGISAVGRE